MSLHEYARKRRFDQTPEPTGSTRGARHRPIFVVQLHHASSRHYDFRLEADGVLKSWAVPKGPSLRAGEKRLAVEVEDHPLDYASFEGDIPAGHYGAGHVDVFDHGHWASEGEPLAAIAAGKLDFVLTGEKLGGAWKLVRTQMKGRQKQWLLIKRDDAFAADQEADDLVDRPPPAKPPRPNRAKPQGASRQVAKPPKRSGTKRDAAWRKRALALDGARDTPYPAGFAAQLCTLRTHAPTGEDWLHEIKWDGYRLLADLVEGQVRLRSRNGLDWNDTFPEIVEAVRALPLRDARLDGELVVIDAQGRSDFAALQRSLEGTSKTPLRYLVFDLPGVAGVDISRAPLVQRKALLKALIGPRPGLIAYSEHVAGHGAEVLAASAKAGLEGIVSKRADAPYAGQRSGTWIKAKHEQSDEFAIVGYTPPKGARTGFGSLLLARVQDGALQYVGRVGTGFDDATLAALLKRLQALHSDQAAVALPAHVPFNARSVHWVRPRLLAEVAYRGWGKEGLLRQAAFKRLREDKTMADLKHDAAPDKAVTITHPDRVVYPADGITKGQVADYYQRVARWLLPELAGRPLSLLRCPDGAGGECFFQKHHAPSLGPGVHAVPLKQKSGQEDYLYVEDVEGVLALVQMNTLELHPWGATVAAPEKPDRLVFDLDPGPGVSWTQTKAAAREVRDNLRKAGLESFVRLSGGKGLHVVVPITPGPSWETVKAFCEAFANAMAQHRPERYVATMRKDQRGNKIFIDWLRNGRGNTSVCSWSLRAREHATVAVPLRWEDLGRVRSPGAFTLDKALQRAARLRRDPWEGMAGLKQALPHG